MPLFSPWKNSLSVLAYHRIIDVNSPNFSGYRPVVSASPRQFYQQMSFLKRWYTIISQAELLSWLHGQQPLPSSPLLITFDDGYLDNYQYAFPILRDLGLPAIVFLTTDFVDGVHHFYWDHVADLFCKCDRLQGHLPVLGFRKWKTLESRDQLVKEWVSVVKKYTEKDKRAALDLLGDVLMPGTTLSLHNKNMTWDMVRRMVDGGIEMGAHTCAHPILTKVSLNVVKHEVRASKRRIEQETGAPVVSFAYPNGWVTDFNEDVEQILRAQHLQLAYSLVPGPMPLRQVRKRPLAIRRITISHKDYFFRFFLKTVMAGALWRQHAYR